MANMYLIIANIWLVAAQLQTAEMPKDFDLVIGLIYSIFTCMLKVKEKDEAGL